MVLPLPALAHSDAMPPENGDRRVGRGLREVMQVRLTRLQAAYLEERAEENTTSISEEMRRCVDEAMVASLEARKRRHAEAQRALGAIDRGEADPEDYPHLFFTGRRRDAPPHGR